MGSLNEAMLDDDGWATASAFIDEAVGAKGSILTFGDERVRGNIQIYFSRAYYRGEDRSAWQREYFRDYYPEDEHLPRLRALPDAAIVPVADLFTEQELRTSRMYNEALARFHGQKGLTMRLAGPSGSRIVWGIADPVDASGWSSSRVDMISRIVPYLRQYVRVRTALVDARAIGVTAAELLGNVRVGVIEIGWNGEIVEANDLAMAVLRENEGLSDRDGVLRAAAREDDEKLQDLLAQALPRFGEQGASGSMTVRHSWLVLHVKPVEDREREQRSQHVGALVLLVDPAVRAKIDRGCLQATLGLSPAEAEIAALLASGWTTREIAARTGRGYNTVRTHLKHVFAKLGVSRQLEVAQVVTALSNLSSSRE